MPRARWITHDGRTLRLSQWAAEAGLRPQTLWTRLERGLPMHRALATGVCTFSEAGRRAYAVTPWRILVMPTKATG